jgi:hypothetical protein
MKRRFLLIMLLMAMFAPLAMQAQEMVLSYHSTLQAAPTKDLTMQRTAPTRDAGWLQYDDGTLSGAYGADGTYRWIIASMFPSSMLGTNNTLTKVALYEYATYFYQGIDLAINIYSGGDTEPGTLLFTDSIAPSGTNGFHEMELSQAVTFDPSQNLWISFSIIGSYALIVCEAATDPNSQWMYSSSNGWGASGIGQGWTIRGYVEYVDPASCPKPTQLVASDITLNTATLSWNGEARSYQVVYSNREGFDPDSATPIDVNETSYSLTNLTDGTTYYAYVRANCGDSYSPWSSMISFTTVSACAVPYNATASDITANSANLTWNGWQDSYSLRYTVPAFFDDFENGLNNWTIITAGEAPQANGWYTINPISGLDIDAHSGSYVASAWSWNSDAYNADNWLITPEVELGGALSFWVYTNSGYPDSYEVLLATEGNETTNFTTVLQAMAPAPTTGEWSEVSIDLSAYSGTGYIAIHHVDYDANYLLVDDFLVDAANATWTTVNDVTSPYALTGLTDDTQYVLQIQGNCPQGTTDWSSITSFTTLPLCQAPVLSLDEVTTTTATISWTGDARAYNIKLNGQLIEQDFRDNSYTINNLNPGTYYTVEVQSNCGETGTSEWTSVSFYTKCEAFDLPYTYGFEDLSDLACWDMLSASDNVFGVVNIAEAGITEFEAYEGENAFVFSSYDQADSYAQLLMSPQLNTEAAVAFEFSYIVFGEDATEEVLVLYSTGTDDLDDFEVADAITAENTDAWMTYNTILPAGTKYVALYYYSDWQYYLFVDGFSFEEATEEVTQETALTAGWNWFSTYIEVENPVAMLQALEASLGNNATQIKNSRINTEYDEEWGWFGDLDDEGMTNEEMYKIFVTTPCTVTLQGTPANTEEHSITINQGWNWIGFPSSVAISLENAFANFAAEGDKIKNRVAQIEYDPEWGWFGDFENLEPGQGYLYYSPSSTPRTLVYNTGAKTRANFGSFTKQPIKKVADINCKTKNGNQLKK